MSSSIRAAPSCRVANGFVQLVTHVLAHVPLARAGNLHDPRYVNWAAAQHDPAAGFQDGAVLARAWARDPRLDRLHWFFALHDSLERFERTAARELAALRPAEVARPALLASLCTLPCAELVHANLGLLAPQWTPIFAALEAQMHAGCVALAEVAQPLCTVLPEFGSQSIELVWALGVHGRAFEGRVLVGAPAAWNGCSPGRQAVLAAHEHCVAGSAHTGYVEAEWEALCTLSARMLGLAQDEAIRAAHRQWLAGLDLDDLLAAQVERGRLDAGPARRLRAQPEIRAAILASYFVA